MFPICRKDVIRKDVTSCSNSDCSCKHVNMPDPIRKLWPITAITASGQPDSGRIVYAGSGLVLGGLVRLWPNGPGRKPVCKNHRARFEPVMFPDRISGRIRPGYESDPAYLLGKPMRSQAVENDHLWLVYFVCETPSGRNCISST